MNIRPSHAADATAIAAIYRPFCEDTSVSFETCAPSAAEMAARMEKITRTHPWLVADVDGAVAGYAYASPHRERAAYRWSVEVTVYLHSDFRRRGLGRSLYGELFRLLRQQGYFHAYAGVTLPNEASVALHRALGFTAVGIYQRVGFKAGAWRDVAWWQLALQSIVAQPVDPRPWPEVQAMNFSSGPAL